MNNDLLAYLADKYKDEKPDLFDIGVSQSTATAPAVTPPPEPPNFKGLTTADLPVNNDDNGISTDLTPGMFGENPVDAPPTPPAPPVEPPPMPAAAPGGPKVAPPPPIAPPAPSAAGSTPIPEPGANPAPPAVDPLGGFSPADRQKVVDDAQPGAREIIGESLAGLGDAISKSFGRSNGGNHLKGAMAAVDAKRSDAITNFDKNAATAKANYEVARQIVANNRADKDQANLRDATSPTSREAQKLMDRLEPKVDHSKMSAFEIELVSKPMLELHKMDETASNRKMMTDYLMGKKDEETGTKFEQEMNASKARAGALGDNMKRLNSSERVLNLIEQVKGNPNAMQTPEVAQAVASLIGGGGGVVSQQQVEHLMPQSLVGNVNKFVGWLTNNPRGLEQQKFIASYMHTAERERDLINRQMVTAQAKSASGYMDYIKRNPDKARAKLEAQGVPEEMIQKILSGDFKDLDKMAPTSARPIPKMPMHGDTSDGADADGAKTWLAQNPYDPQAPAVRAKLKKMGAL